MMRWFQKLSVSTYTCTCTSISTKRFITSREAYRISKEYDGEYTGLIESDEHMRYDIDLIIKSASDKGLYSSQVYIYPRDFGELSFHDKVSKLQKSLEKDGFATSLTTGGLTSNHKLSISWVPDDDTDYEERV